MNRLLERLQAGHILVADGAVGTMLFAKGLKVGDCPERVNLEHPKWLEEIAQKYSLAGAQIVQTNTFGASPLKLAQYGLENKTEEIIKAAVRAVRKAVGKKVLISGSLGPCGRLLKPYGDVEPNEVQESFVRQIKALINEGIDLLCIETMTDLTEAKIAVRAAKSLSPSIPVAATMTFDPTPRGFFTIMGVSIEQAANELSQAGADIVGSNCGNGIENMVKIACEFRKHTALPLMIQSNAGLPEIRGERTFYPETPSMMADRCSQLLKTGVQIIGGCCGTTPDHISAIRAVVDRFATDRRAPE